MKEQPKQEPKTINVLLDEFTNNVAGIKAFNQCISLGNVLSDNNDRLICIDVDNHLKVFKGDILQTETKLNITPVGIVFYYSIDRITTLKSPFLAVAGGIYIYIYKNLKGTLKFPIPNQIPNSIEEYLYDQLSKGFLTAKECLDKLEKLSEKLTKFGRNQQALDQEKFTDIIGQIDDEKVLENKHKGLSNMTQELFSLKNEKLKIQYLEENHNKKIVIYNYITLISSIPSVETYGEEPISYLIVGTENCYVFVIDPKENKTLNKSKLPGVPFLISANGGYDAEHKIMIADRGCNIYILKKKDIVRTIIVPQPLANLLSTGNSIYIGTIGRNYISLRIDGSQNFSILQPSTITSMELAARRIVDENLVLIATKNCQLRIYKDKILCHVLKLADNIFGMKYGTFGDKPESLILFTYSGCLLVKYFNKDIRVSSLSHNDRINEAEKKKLDYPKKTQLYVDLVQKEKDTKKDMYKRFMVDLLRIKYKAMDSYAKMLKSGNAPQNYGNTSKMKISAFLEGLGPNFKLNLVFNNSGNEPITGAILTLSYNRKLFAFNKESIQLCLIMPNVPVNYSLPFKNISETGSSGNIKVIVLDKDKNIPLIQTTIKVPISELDIL